MLLLWLQIIHCLRKLLQIIQSLSPSDVSVLLQSQFKHTTVDSAVSAPKEFEEIRNARVFYLVICIFFDCSPNRCNCIQAH